MTNEEVRQLWIKSGQTLIVERLDKEEGTWERTNFPAFEKFVSYRFYADQDFSIINDQTEKEWEDSGRTLDIEVASPQEGRWVWALEDNPHFYYGSIYCISHSNPKKEILKQRTSTDAIIEACEQIKMMLLEKNRKYGDSALNPVRVFSKADAGEQLKVRMDDKLSRIQNAQDDDLEDPMMDLTGYLVLDLARKIMTNGGINDNR